MVKPAGLVMNGVGSTGLPWTSTLTSEEAVTSSNIRLVGIEQEMMLGPRNPRRQMGEDEVVPAIISDQPIGGGEIDPDRPFLVADLALHATGFRRSAIGAGRRSIPRLMVSTRFMRGVLLGDRSGWAAAKAAMGAGRFVGAAQRRIRRDRHREPPRIVELRDEADVGEGRLRRRTGRRRRGARPLPPARPAPRSPNARYHASLAPASTGRARPADI